MGKRIYGLVSTIAPDHVRYVGSTRMRMIVERYAQHMSLARNNYSGTLYDWVRSVWMAGGEVDCVDLTAIEDLSERKWVKKLQDGGADLFNVQLTSGHGEVLERAWLNPTKRANMLDRDEELRLRRAAEGVRSDFTREKIRINRKFEPSVDLKERIQASLTGRKFGPHDETRKFNQARAVKLWHRQRQLGPYSADVAWLRLLWDVTKHGEIVSPRGDRTLELRSSLVVVDMTSPVVTISQRKLGYKFMCAEAAWILSGDNSVAALAPFSKKITEFSDDGVAFFGAYGPKISAQMVYLINALRSDPNTRRAVINIWRESPSATKDYPCTMSCQFMIRDGMLDAYVTMRSNDVWLGACYDVFNFSMLGAYVLLELNMPEIKLGSLYHTAVSRHLYERNLASVEECLKEMEVGFVYTPLDLSEFNDGADLTRHLWALARRSPEMGKRKWLMEMVRAKNQPMEVSSSNRVETGPASIG